MGNSHPIEKSHSKDEASTTAHFNSANSKDEQVWEQNIEIHHCCGVSIKKVRRKRIDWESIFLENCISLRQEFPWANEMIDFVKGTQMTKSKYYAEVVALKKEAEVQGPTQTEQLNTPAEKERFKDNLKRSVILSVSASKKSVNTSQIASMIEGAPRSRIAIERSNYLNCGNCGSSRNSKVVFQKAKSVSSKASFSRSIISLIDDTITSVLGNEKEITRQSAHDLEVFLKFCMILERHLFDPSCILARIRSLFFSYFSKSYQDPENASLRAGDFVDNVKQFLVLLREAVYDYYNLHSFSEFFPGNLFIANEENVLSACTAILFKDPNFYAQAFSMAVSYCRSREGHLSLIFDRLQGSPPERFMVDDKFCLGQRTVKAYLQGSKERGEGSQEMKDKIVSNQQPYRVCMEVLRELDKSKSPISKMKAIVGCSDSITSEIERFYQSNGLKHEKWVLDADQVLSIFCYILVGAKVDHLLAHLFILQNFATSHQMISVSGYYLSVLNCAVEQLEADYDHQMEAHQL